jgi:hypothetical protein
MTASTYLCWMHEDDEPEHWTATPVGVKSLVDGVWDGTVSQADRCCAERNVEAWRIVDASEITGRLS